MAIENKDFCRRIYEDLELVYSFGFRGTDFSVPVVDRPSNRMTLGYDMGLDNRLPTAPHELKLNRHPTGIFSVNITSEYGLSCPDPMPCVGIPRETYEIYAKETTGAVKRHEVIGFTSSLGRCALVGGGYDGINRAVTGLDGDAQELFIEQLVRVMERRVEQGG